MNENLARALHHINRAMDDDEAGEGVMALSNAKVALEYLKEAIKELEG